MNAIPKEFTAAIEAQFAKLDKDVQKALTDAGTIKAAVEDLEQKAARPGGGGSFHNQSWGAQVVASDSTKAFAGTVSSQKGHVRIEMKDITSAASSGSALAPAMRDPAVNMMPQRLPRIRDLLTVINTASGSVEYADQMLRDNNAAPQTEAGLKGRSNYEWTLQNLPIRTIAHWDKASVQILADAPQLESLIDNELRYGLAIAEEEQLLAGDGIAPNLDGLITNAAAYAAAFVPVSETMIDKIGLGMLQVTLADYMPNGVAMHPSDWMRIRLLKDADGKYLLGDPGDPIPPVLFGLPVVATTAMTQDKFLIGDFGKAATLYDRQAPTVALSTEDGDNFRTNMVTIRAEERLGLAIKNSAALSYGDFGNTP